MISLSRSPFGGFVLSDQVNVVAGLQQLIPKFLKWATDQGITSIVIRCMPEVYDPIGNKKIKEILIQYGFLVRYHDTTQVLSVSKQPPRMADDRKHALKKCMKMGFVFQQVDWSKLDEAYDLIVESRKSKRYPVTMTLADLIEAFEKFPDHYLLFGVFTDNRMIATSVSIVVNDQILYCFYLGDSLAYRQYSPVTFLVTGIYQYCNARNITLLDLGISTDRGILNEGLYRFKKSLGCLDSDKLTFEKKI